MFHLHYHQPRAASSPTFHLHYHQPQAVPSPESFRHHHRRPSAAGPPPMCWMTLLLGPPGSRETTLLRVLAGVLHSDLRVIGDVTYCGHHMSEFIPQRTCAYISQHDVRHGEMTVRETFDFAGRCLGVGTRYDLLAEPSQCEKEEGIKPDPVIDAFMKATTVPGQESSLVANYVLKTNSWIRYMC